MEYQDNKISENNLRPSRKFIIRGSIAILSLIVILSVQSFWFKKLFEKKAEEIITPTTTLGQIIGKDTNGNGIADWEEKLWGLDPSVLYTNGVSNKQIIEDKKKSLGVDDATIGANLNETDQISRQLFTITTALGQSDQISTQDLQNIASNLGSSIDIKKINNKYSLSDIKTTKTTTISLNNYYENMSKKIEIYENSSSEIEIIVSALENGDNTGLVDLKKSSENYKKIASELSTITVPIGIANYHLSIVNSLYGISESLPYLQELDQNGISSLIGVALYKGYSDKLDKTLSNLNIYLKNYGIIE